MDKKPNTPETDRQLTPLTGQEPVKEEVRDAGETLFASATLEAKRGIPSQQVPKIVLDKEDEAFGTDDDNNYFTLGGEA